jgi:hypothetical protein
MSIIATPTLNSTEIIQVATPFSYSFTYSTPISTSDTPVYYVGDQVYDDGTNSTAIVLTTYVNPINVKGLPYTISNMIPVTDVLQCVLPIMDTSYSFNVGSYVTFGGTPLYIEGGPTNGHFATFEGSKFAYGLDSSTEDSLECTVSNSSPVTSFIVKLRRPYNTIAYIDCTINANVMTVTKLYSQLSGGGQVTVGMQYTSAGSPSRSFTVSSYISGVGGVFGGLGTYGVTPTDGGGTINSYIGTEIGDYPPIAGAGDVILSASMTPAGGIAMFLMDAPFTYTPEV